MSTLRCNSDPIPATMVLVTTVSGFCAIVMSILRGASGEASENADIACPPKLIFGDVVILLRDRSSVRGHAEVLYELIMFSAPSVLIELFVRSTTTYPHVGAVGPSNAPTDDIMLDPKSTMVMSALELRIVSGSVVNLLKDTSTYGDVENKKEHFTHNQVRSHHYHSQFEC